MVSPFLVASALAIIPALGLLFYLLNRYEGYFEDARVFFALTVGFFAGLVVAFLENVAFRFDSPEFTKAASIAFAFAYYVAGYAFLESATKTAVLGSRKFRSRKDTPYYGAALGIGFGAMLALQTIALGLDQGDLLNRSFDGTWLTVAGLLIALATAATLTHGASGVWVGRGAAEGRLWKGLLQGALLQMPLLVCFWFYPKQAGQAAVVPAVAALAYGIALIVYTQRRILDTIVPPEIRDQVQKERRRSKRRGQQG